MVKSVSSGNDRNNKKYMRFLFHPRVNVIINGTVEQSRRTATVDTVGNGYRKTEERERGRDTVNDVQRDGNALHISIP